MEKSKKDVEKQPANKQTGGVTGKGWVKGKSGNPNGRPKKGSSWSDVANQLLDAKELDIKLTLPNGSHHQITCKIEDGNTIRHAVVGALIVEALKGNIQAIRELADRTEGKPAQRVETELTTRPKGFNVRLLQ